MPKSSRQPKKTPAQLDAEIAEALSRANKAKLTAEYQALKRALRDPALSKADAQVLQAKLTTLDAELVALNTAEYLEYLSKPVIGGY